MPELADMLGSLAEQVLETMFYTAVLGPASETEGSRLAAVVTFTGSRTGTVVVSAPESTAKALTADFLGIDLESVPEGHVPTVLGELANVLCGAMLARIDPAGGFVISPPSVSGQDESLLAAEDMAVWRTFELEKGDLTVGLTMS